MTRSNRKRKGVRSMYQEWKEPGTPPMIEEDASKMALGVRCGHLGMANTERNRRRVKWGMFGDPAGRAIKFAAKDEDEEYRLWQVFERYDRAHANYNRRILGQRRFANSMKLELLPERFSEPDPDAQEVVDVRTSEEKDRDATNAWRKWMGRTAQMRVHERMALYDGLLLRCDLTKGTECTTAGIAFVMALRVLRDIADDS